MKFALIVLLTLPSLFQATTSVPDFPTHEPSYLSDTDPAYAFLAQLQNNLNAAGIAKPLWQSNRDERDRLMQMSKSYAENYSRRPPPTGPASPYPQDEIDADVKAIISEQLPTPYEDPVAFFLLKRRMHEIDKARAALGYPVSQELKFGTLPLINVNARTFAVPGSTDHIIAFQPYLLVFALKMTRVALRPTRMDHEGGIDHSPFTARQIIQSDHDVNDAFCDTLLNFQHFRRSKSSYQLSPDYEEITEGLSEAAQLFVLGHELGHIIAKHKPANAEYRFADDGSASGCGIQNHEHAQTMGAQTSAPGVVYSWLQELEADHYGFLLMSKGLELKLGAERVPLFRTGALLFLTAMDLLETPTGMAQGSQFDTREHEIEQIARRVKFTLANDTHLPTISGVDEATFQPLRNGTDHPPAVLRRAVLMQTLRSSVVHDDRESSQDLSLYQDLARNLYSLRDNNANRPYNPAEESSTTAQSAMESQSDSNIPSFSSELIIWRDKPISQSLAMSDCVTAKVYVLDSDYPYIMGHFTGAFAAERPWKQDDGSITVAKAGTYTGTITKRSVNGWEIELARNGAAEGSLELGDYPNNVKGSILLGVTRYSKDPCKLTDPQTAIHALKVKYPQLERSSHILLRIIDTPAPR